MVDVDNIDPNLRNYYIMYFFIIMKIGIFLENRIDPSDIVSMRIGVLQIKGRVFVIIMRIATFFTIIIRATVFCIWCRYCLCSKLCAWIISICLAIVIRASPKC